MSRLYTYLPKDNTALTEGLLSTALTDNGFEKYRGRTGKYKKEDVLKVLDSWEPEWTRSKAISMFSEPIPEYADKRMVEFANSKHLYSVELGRLIANGIVRKIRAANTGNRGGTHRVKHPMTRSIDWKSKKPGKFLFSYVPHYLVETADGRIPPEYVTDEELHNDISFIKEKKAEKINIPSIYDSVRTAYEDMGYQIIGDRLKISRQPTYNDGRPVPEGVISPDESGGNTQDDGVVRINPEYRKVMRHWKINGKGRDFLESIIGHELGHHIDRTVFNYSYKDSRRKKLLKEIEEGKFHTVYTDIYDKDKIDRRKLDKELLAEYLSSLVKKKLEERRSKK